MKLGFLQLKTKEVEWWEGDINLFYLLFGDIHPKIHDMNPNLVSLSWKVKNMKPKFNPKLHLVVPFVMSASWYTKGKPLWILTLNAGHFRGTFPQQPAVEPSRKNGPNICKKNNKIMYYISVSLCNGKTPGTIYSMIKTLTKSKTKEYINMTLLLILIKPKHVFLFFRVWNSPTPRKSPRNNNPDKLHGFRFCHL